MNIHHRKGEALGTHRHISYMSEEETHFKYIINIIQDFEQKYSRFIDNSLLSQLNTHKKIIADKEFLDILSISLHAYEQTDGYFSPFIGTVLTNLGYDKNYSFKKKNNPDIVGKDIHINKNEVILGENTTIDIGGFGKGYLIDKIGQYFTEHQVHNWIINGGGDVRVNQDTLNIFGSIGLQHSIDKNILVGQVALQKGAITCSSSHQRKRGDAHHLINPKEGKPYASNISNIYVYSEHACHADIASTTLCVCGIENGTYYAEKLGVMYVIIFDDNRTVYSKDFPNLEMY